MAMDLELLHQHGVLGEHQSDVGRSREQGRQRRLVKVVVVLGALATWLWWRVLISDPLALPRMTPRVTAFLPIALLIVMLGAALLVPLIGAGRSPHVLYRPDELDVSFADVKGADVVVEEVVKTLNLFLGHKLFRDQMGGNPRRAVLFEGPPGTGKTYLAKAMAREAGVPFLFVNSSAFQSMFYGQTNRKIRSYFKALRSASSRRSTRSARPGPGMELRPSVRGSQASSTSSWCSCNPSINPLRRRVFTGG
jgi:hypothetical protein